MYASVTYLVTDSYGNVLPHTHYVKYDPNAEPSTAIQVHLALFDKYPDQTIKVQTIIEGIESYISHLMLFKEPKEEAKIKARKQKEAEERERASQNR